MSEAQRCSTNLSNSRRESTAGRSLFPSRRRRAGLVGAMASLAVVGSLSISAPAMAATTTPPTTPAKVTQQLGAVAVAPKPVQALETWIEPGATVINVAFKQPTTGPALYRVELYNITSGKVEQKVETTTVPSPDSPLTLDSPKSGNYVVRVFSVNAAGTSESTSARAMLDGKISPVNWLRSGWVASGTDYQLNLTWNPPNHSAFGRITTYRILNASGTTVATVKNNAALLTVAQSKNLKGSASVVPVAADGTTGPAVSLEAKYPTNPMSVTDVVVPSNVLANQTVDVTAMTTGFADGATATAYAIQSDSNIVRVGGAKVMGDRVTIPTTFTQGGPSKLYITVSDGVQSVDSSQTAVQVYAQVSVVTVEQATKTSGDRFVHVKTIATGIPAGTSELLQIQEPGSSTWKDAYAVSADSDGAAVFDKDDPATAISGQGGLYKVRIKVDSPAPEIPDYYSAEQPFAVASQTATLVSADKKISDDNVVFSATGTTSGYASGTPLAMLITRPDGSIASVSSAAVVNADGSFTVDSSRVKSAYTIDGTYQVAVTVGSGTSAKTTGSGPVTVWKTQPFIELSGTTFDGSNAQRYLSVQGTTKNLAPGQAVMLQVRKPGDASYRDAYSAVVDSSGNVAFTKQDAATMVKAKGGTYEIRAVYRPPFDPSASYTSEKFDVEVKTNTLEINSAQVKSKKLSVTGNTKGYATGSTVTLAIQKPGTSEWVTIATTTTQGGGTYQFSSDFSAYTAGKYGVQVTIGTGDNQLISTTTVDAK